MLREILHDKSGCEYVVTCMREYGRYTVKVNGVFWATAVSYTHLTLPTKA